MNIWTRVTKIERGVPFRAAAAVFLGLNQLASASVAEGQAVSTSMRIARHAGVTAIPSANWPPVMTQATDAFHTDNGMLDLPCDLALNTLDTGWWYSSSATDSYPNTQGQYEAAINNASDAYINVVNNVDWCGGMGTWIGCATQNSFKPFIVDRESVLSGSGIAGILIAHEFGHTVNSINTAAGHDTQGRQIMDPTVVSNNNMVRFTTTCTRFRHDFGPTCPPNGDNSSSNPAVCSVAGADLVGKRDESAIDRLRADETPAEEDRDWSETPVDRLAASLVIIDSIPMNLDQFYGRDDVAVLKQIMPYANRQRNVLALIGLISQGDKEDIDELLRVAAEPGSDMSAASMAVGYIVARTGKDYGVDALIERLQSKDERTYETAAMGLALSGNERALEALEARAPKEYDPFNVLSVAPDENRRVAALGLRGYYTEPRKEEHFDLPQGMAGHD